MTQPYITLNNGNAMPQFGLGVWQIPDGSAVEAAVRYALDTGYRLIDTAAVYGNEIGVGKAIKESGVPREDIFVTTKLWNHDQGYEQAFKAFDASLGRMGLDYIDLYLIHWPVPSLGKYIETWRAFEEIYKSGRAKAIGVSNFTPAHLERLLKEAEIVPAVNQIEIHPRFPQHDTVNFCSSHGIAVESWSPLGGRSGVLLNDPEIIAIGNELHKSPAQVIIHWHLQRGLIVIPKSGNDERIAENFNVFDFTLDEAQLKRIASLTTNIRVGADPDTAHFT